MRIKSFLYVLMAAVAMTFAACSSDDPDDDGGSERKYVWSSDWNDPNDPNYKPNGYNPIQGVWRSVKNPKQGLCFTEDRIRYNVKFDSDDKYTIDPSPYPYLINDKAYKISKHEGDGIKLYKFQDGLLYVIDTKLGGYYVEDWGVGFTRVEEKQ